MKEKYCKFVKLSDHLTFSITKSFFVVVYINNWKKRIEGVKDESISAEKKGDDDRMSVKRKKKSEITFWRHPTFESDDNNNSASNSGGFNVQTSVTDQDYVPSASKPPNVVTLV